MSEEKLEALIEEMINAAILGIPSYLNEIQENKEILKVENPRVRIWGRNWNVTDDSWRSSQWGKRNANTKRSNQSKRYHIQAHSRHQRKDFRLTWFTSRETTFSESMQETRIAGSHGCILHAKHAPFVFHRNLILTITDYKIRRCENVKVAKTPEHFRRYFYHPADEITGFAD